MNKKGGAAIYAMMIGITIIVLALALAPPVRDITATAMNQTVGDTIGLDCTNSSISDFNKATCVVTDFSIFYFVAGLIFIGGAIAVAKIIL